MVHIVNYLFRFALVAIVMGVGSNLPVVAQTISGVINSYAKVLTIDDCGESFEVRSSLDQTNFAVHFASAKQILIMQMQGAIISLSDDGSFGAIEDYTQAGYFEFADIDAVTYLSSQTIGSTTWYDYEVAVDAALQHWYDPSQSVQIVSVPEYVHVTINGNVTAEAWDPDIGTGGIVVFDASGTVTFSADIDVSGQGFLGGGVSANGSSVGEFGYVYAENTGGNIFKAGDKGEGIAQIDRGRLSGGLLSDRIGGRGRAASGGGGGNALNAGGGGGGSAGKGGKGGNQLVTSGKAAIGGLGGAAFDYAAPLSRVMMGGGGGGGHQNDDSDGGTTTAGAGGNGGGIVLIKAQEINATGQKIKANGADGSNGNGDGGGGGGAGGAIIIDCSKYVLTNNPALSLEVKGGAGGDASGTTTACHGPGGGGSGGLVWLSDPSKDPKVKVDDDNTTTGDPGLLGGAAGAPTSCTDPNVDATNGAKAGEKGVLLQNLVLP